MIETYADCSRCGEPIVGHFIGNEMCYEAVCFSEVNILGISRCSIAREDEDDQKAYAEVYALCPDCMADTLDFVRGKYRAITHEGVCECEASNDGIE